MSGKLSLFDDSEADMPPRKRMKLLDESSEAQSTTDSSGKAKKKKKKSKKDKKDKKKDKKEEEAVEEEENGEKEKEDEEDADNSRIELTVNEEYAKRYEVRKRKEELSRLKDLGLSLLASEEESESEAVEEDEEGELATYVVDSFMTVLPLIAEKKEDIYQPDKKFFPDEIVVDEDKKPKKPQQEKMRFKDIVRKEIMEKFEKDEDAGESDEDEKDKMQTDDEKDLTIAEAQKRARLEFLKAVDGVSGGGGDDEGFGGLSKRVRTAEEEEQFENEYQAFLQAQAEKEAQDENEKAKAKFLKDFWLKRDGLDETERFLRDYIVNKRWIDRGFSSRKKKRWEDEDEDDIPKGDSADSGAVDNLEIDPDEDEEYLEKQDEFEAAYNFRFEEPDGDKIISYPRVIPDSVRVETNKRKEARKRRKERKEKEKQKLEEEKRHLLKLKRDEIVARVQKLMETAGLSNLDDSKLDLFGEFDPEKHEKIMNELFNEEYYNNPDEQMPEFEDDEDLKDKSVADKVIEEAIASHSMQSGSAEEGEGEEGEEAQDVAEESEEAESAKSKKDKKKKKKKLTFEEIEKREEFKSLVDEYYKLEYEDLVAGIPVKFKYVQVKPYDYGLNALDILMADDKELNKIVSIKKLQPYREDQGIPKKKKNKHKKHKKKTNKSQESQSVSQE